ncbi:MAG: DUF4157 domain-containing protein, partial [Holophagales bacterium]|nr:DUF4157 domain-containing protein [Holophagales bacterium]
QRMDLQRMDAGDDDMMSAKRVDGNQRMDEYDDDYVSAKRAEGIQRMDLQRMDAGDDDMMSAKRVSARRASNAAGKVQRSEKKAKKTKLQSAAPQTATPEADVPQMRDATRRTIVRSAEPTALRRDSLQRDSLQRDEGAGGALQSGNSFDGGPLQDGLESEIQGAKGGGQALDDTVRAPMEQAFGTSFEGVKVHTDGQADTLNRDLDARAFTTGSDIFFRQGQYQPDSSEGKSLLAHELTHVVQQGGGES